MPRALGQIVSTPEIVCKTAFFDAQDRLLVLKRASDDVHRPNEVDLPGGAGEPEEAITMGAAREIAEGIGIGVGPTNLTLVDLVYCEGADRDRIKVLFAAVIPPQAKIVLSPEHSSYEWLPLKDAITAFNGLTWYAGLMKIQADPGLRPKQ